MITERVRFRTEERGTALLEFAISLMAVLTVLIGVVDIGRALYAYDWVSNAARTGTRFAIVRGATCTHLAGGCPATKDDVINFVKSDAIGIDKNQLRVTTLCWVTHNVASDPPCAAKGWVQVRVQYNFRFLSPFTPFMWTMQSSSERVVQN